MFTVEATPTGKNLLSVLNQNSDQDSVQFWWLGQAGFALRYKKILLLIDPYLSNSLAEKYQNSEFKHLRMMPIPFSPEQLGNCRWYLCTHGHTDHMDSVTIQAILKQSNPYFLTPRAEIDTGKERGIPHHRMKTINAGEALELEDDISIEAVASKYFSSVVLR